MVDGRTLPVPGLSVPLFGGMGRAMAMRAALAAAGFRGMVGQRQNQETAQKDGQTQNGQRAFHVPHYTQPNGNVQAKAKKTPPARRRLRTGDCRVGYQR